jgi:hypothetical protein
MRHWNAVAATASFTLARLPTELAEFTAMRIVSILSGLAVLFTTLAFGHLLHHYFVNAGEAAHSPPFLAGMIIGGIVGIFSLIGGCLLLRRGR